MSRRRRRGISRTLSLPGLALIFVIVFAAVLAFATSISGVNPPRLDAQASAVSGYALEPQQCKDNGISPSSVRTNSAPNGDTGSTLILGGSGANTLHGRGGNDCIVGGGGGDHLYGDAGFDVCIGGSGNDILDATCEVQVQ
jgi:hypothetical protein